jgi:argininosuccinate lyase
MTKLWQGRLDGHLPPEVALLNNAISFDQRLYPHDIRGSIAHARMLGNQDILDPDEAARIIETLERLQSELDAGTLAIDADAEDIHTFVEGELTRRLGEVGKKLHTGRSRNDQVALDLRLFVREEIDEIQILLARVQSVLSEKAREHAGTLMPGYTHLQRAQPVTLGNHLMAYHAMMSRDVERLDDARCRLNRSPLGAGALAGSSFPLDRQAVAKELGFEGVLENTLDAVADRDFLIEVLSALAILMMHLSRLCEELVLWSSQEFGFISLDEAYTTGSSMMPQKKNPDVAELIRGKTGRVYGSLVTLLTVMKALPLAYNKDMQEDKEALFDAVDTVKRCLPPLAGMVATMTPHPEVLRAAVREGFVNATALADYLVRKGMPFRDAYALVGQVVKEAMARGETLESLPIESYQQFSSAFEADLYDAVRLPPAPVALS